MTVKRTIVALIAASTFASIAWAAEPPHVITAPDWLKKPTEQDLAQAWPVEAFRKGVPGRVVIHCVVTAQGILTDCDVVSEKPEGAGFGAAAVLLSQRFLMKPMMVDGKAVGGATVQIPINFEALGGPMTGRTGSHIPQPAPSLDTIYMLKDMIWESTPSRAQVAAVHPKGRGAGRVVLTCELKATGELRGCRKSFESPENKGFGAAARALVPFFKAAPEVLADQDIKALRLSLAIHFPGPAASDFPAALTTVTFVRTLPEDKVQQVFPPKAADAGLKTGRAVLDCVADTQGMMTGCKVLSEDPAGMDFGPAALRVAAAMGVNPWTEDGQPAEGAHVKFAIRLNDKEPAAPTPTATR